MKTRNILLTLAISLCAITGWAQGPSINQIVASLNADAQKPGGQERALKSISASTHIPVATLAKEQASAGLSCGDLYAAHAISNAAGKSFDQVVKQKKGKTWDQVADANNVSLGGKKVKKPGAAPAPTPRSSNSHSSSDGSSPGSGYKARP